MKKAVFLVLLLVSIYVVLVFAFPSASLRIGEKFGLKKLNESIIKSRDSFNEFVTSFDLMQEYKDAKEKALRIKQNVETQAEDTKRKIETIQTNFDKTVKAIDETTKAVNNTIDSLNELQKSVVDIVPKISTGTTNPLSSN